MTVTLTPQFMKAIAQIPLFLVVLIVYNVLAFTPAAGLLASDAAPLFTVNLISGAEWALSFNDLVVLFGVIFLYFELFKSTRTHTASVVEHVFSMFVFIAFLIEFIIVKQCGTSTFLILTMFALLDVVAGFTITISTARRDLAVPGVG